MLTKKRMIVSLATVLAALAAGSAASADVLVQANFDGVSTGQYTTGQTVDGLAVTGDSTSLLMDVVDLGSGNHAVKFTDNAASGLLGLTKSITGISTTGTGNNYITGGFDFVVFSGASTSSQMNFSIGQSGTTPASTSTQQANLRLRASGQVYYINSAGSQTSLATNLTLDRAYHVDITVNLSSDTQDIWSFTITDLTTQTVFASLSDISTRWQNGTPDRIFFDGNYGLSATSANPFIQMDNINFSVIPEPATMGLLAVGGVLALLRRRHT